MEYTPDVTTNQLADETLVGGLGLPAALPHATYKFEKKGSPCNSRTEFDSHADNRR